MRKKIRNVPKARIRWGSAGGVLLIFSTIGLVTFAGWSLMSAGTLKDMRRSLSERTQWLTEVNASLELLETPALRAEQQGTRSGIEKLLNSIENLKLSLTYPHEPASKLLTRIDVTIIDIQEELALEKRNLNNFRKRMRNHLRRAQTYIRSDLVSRADGFTDMARSLNQGLSGAAILAGFSLMLLVNLILRGEEASNLRASHETLEEELSHLQRSQEQHYQQTFESITDNLPRGLIVYRRSEILFANKTMYQLIRPGAKSWEDVEPELDVLVERVKKLRTQIEAEHGEVDQVLVNARRFDGSAIEVTADADLPTIYRGGDAQMIFIQPTKSLPLTELQSA